MDFTIDELRRWNAAAELLWKRSAEHKPFPRVSDVIATQRLVRRINQHHGYKTVSARFPHLGNELARQLLKLSGVEPRPKMRQMIGLPDVRFIPLAPVPGSIP